MDAQSAQNNGEQAGCQTAFLCIACGGHCVLGLIVCLLGWLGVLRRLVILGCAVLGLFVLRRLLILGSLLISGLRLRRLRCVGWLRCTEGISLEGIRLIGVQG